MNTLDLRNKTIDRDEPRKDSYYFTTGDGIGGDDVVEDKENKKEKEMFPDDDGSNLSSELHTQ